MADPGIVMAEIHQSLTAPLQSAVPAMACAILGRRHREPSGRLMRHMVLCFFAAAVDVNLLVNALQP